jgi:hypothetical protein
MLTVLRSATILLAVAGTAPAAPPTFAPAEVADGWVMLFDGESTFGWNVDGEATVTGGQLVVGGAKQTTLLTTVVFPPGSVSYSFNGIGQVPAGQDGPRFGGEKSADGFPIHGTNGHTEAVVIDAEPQRLAIRVPAGQPVRFSRLVFKPSGSVPLFNGKDLTGWKRYTGDPKREKSKFEVTPAGELHLTDGPGDLQTERTFADFWLSLECKTNGKGLNSGVFFRGLPNQYQQGYEAQIHNLFKDGDRAKPTDFGTGAIYRRVPARKVVPNDGQWFTLTVLANGPHLATWVNGYPTVSWTDDRAPAENARQGRYMKAGVISLQGHDPTTDLLFRNIRISEMERGSRR